jgi:hypothetical protein
MTRKSVKAASPLTQATDSALVMTQLAVALPSNWMVSDEPGTSKDCCVPTN